MDLDDIIGLDVDETGVKWYLEGILLPTIGLIGVLGMKSSLKGPL